MSGRYSSSNAEHVALQFAKVDLEYKPRSPTFTGCRHSLQVRHQGQQGRVSATSPDFSFARMNRPAPALQTSIRNSACVISGTGLHREQPLDYRAMWL